ncbi:hypothetical protein DYB38_009439 [Aphanomyces astaci]|uniref:Beta-Casp domain-containing protein n=1 Tax=Aphanomyces astaci TaxID=112090 RepID=A0A397CQA5_APHAT|nr:hypothetical protein DYB38_009439 [Aphanomyces astaci]
MSTTQSSPSHYHVQASELSGSVHGVLLRLGDTNVLLNCGNSSPTTATPITSFSSLGIAPGTIISAILITDWRISSSGMLPMVLSAYHNHHNRHKGKDKQFKHQQGTMPPPSVPPPAVFLTHATRALLPHILKECKNDNTNPAAILNDSSLASMTSLAFGQPHVHPAALAGQSNMTVTAHRAGHVVGGCLYSIEVDGIQVSFVDGVNLHGSRILRRAELPCRPPHVAIINSAYVVEVSETRTVLERELCKEVRDTLATNGKVIIPVYGVGAFFHDLLALLQDYWVSMHLQHVPIYATSDSLVHAASSFLPLCADSYTAAFVGRSPSVPILKLPDLKLLVEPTSRPMVIFTAGASIGGSGDTHRVLRAIGHHPDNLLVLSEFRTPGTINHAFLNNVACADLPKSFVDSIACRLHTFPCGDEVDAREVVELARQCRPSSSLVLRGADASDPFLLEALRPLHLPVTALQVDDVWTQLVPRDLNVRLRVNLAFQGGVVPTLMLAETRKTLYFNNELSGMRRLKKKKHTLAFGHTWKYPKGGSGGASCSKAHKRPGKRTPFGLSMLLSNEASESDDELAADDVDANVVGVLDAVVSALHQWLGWAPDQIERQPTWLRVASVEVSVTPDWSITMNWSFEDEELASRVFGLCQRVVEAQYRDAHQ